MAALKDVDVSYLYSVFSAFVISLFYQILSQTVIKKGDTEKSMYWQTDFTESLRSVLCMCGKGRS